MKITEQISDASAHCILGNHPQENNRARLVKSKREALGKKKANITFPATHEQQT